MQHFVVMQYSIDNTYDIYVVVIQNCHNYQGGSSHFTFFCKMSFMMHCDFDTGSLKINIFKMLFWKEGGHKRCTPCL